MCLKNQLMFFFKSYFFHLPSTLSSLLCVSEGFNSYAPIVFLVGCRWFVWVETEDWWSRGVKLGMSDITNDKDFKDHTRIPAFTEKPFLKWLCIIWLVCCKCLFEFFHLALTKKFLDNVKKRRRRRNLTSNPNKLKVRRIDFPHLILLHSLDKNFPFDR